MAYEIFEGIPDVETYLRLREGGGLHCFSKPAAEMGLRGTYIGVLAKFQGEIVGMGRVIGDGGCFFQIVDIVVIQKHQGCGLGKQITATLLELLQKLAPQSAYVSLIADVPADKLYEKFGFKNKAPQSIGMSLLIQKKP
jgi:ribosomal protein S18 acetylase RimI-like enzyme